MTALQKIQAIAGSILKYLPLAVAAVATVQAEVGSSGGDAGTQATKKQTAVAYVLAAAHAGEAVPNSTVQTIAAIVEMAAGSAKALGAFGKTAAASGSVSVPSSGTAVA